MKKNRKIIRYSTRYSKKARTKRFVLNTLLVVLILAVAVSATLIITGYLVEDKPSSSKNNSSTSEMISDESSSEDSSQSDVSSDLSSSDAPSSDTSSEPAQEFTVQTITMPLDTILSDAKRAEFLENAVEAGYQAVSFEVKNTKGNILYKSKVELASRCGAVSSDAFDLDALIDDINKSGLQAIAVMSALQDPIAAHTDYGTSYTYGDSSYTWLDNSASRGGKAWLNPYLENTQKYLTDLTEELSEAGCSQIIVEHLCFPTQYTSKLNQGSSSVSRQDMLAQLCEKITIAAGDCDVAFSFDAESYFDLNTDQYDGNPSSISGLTAIAPRIQLAELKKADAFKDIDMSQYSAENIRTVLEQVAKACPNAAIIPIFETDALSQEVLDLLKEYGITQYICA